MGEGEVLVGSDRSRSTQRVQAPQLSVRVAHTRVVRRRQGRQQNNDVESSLSLCLSLSQQQQRLTITSAASFANTPEPSGGIPAPVNVSVKERERERECRCQETSRTHVA